VAAVTRIINTLDTPGDNYPILNLDDPRFSPKTELLDRPLSADVPLAEPERLLPILDRLWALAIPHVTIVAGPQANAAWLVRAVERAEDLGMIAGVRGRATELAQGTLVADLARAGVDHINAYYLAASDAVHDALAGPGDHAQAMTLFGRIAASEVCPMAEVPLVAPTLPEIDRTLDTLGRQGVRNVGFFAVATAASPPVQGPLLATQMAQAARTVEEAATDAEVRFLWYAPVQFTPALSLGEQLLRGPRCSGDLAIRVAPDGSVLPARGPARVAGNLLTDTWEAIQSQPAYADYRRRLLSDTHCDDCPGLAVCAADCPRNPAGWAEVRPA
jgi:radical SAM protein with 4Fe4S-binding SPASM domain